MPSARPSAFKGSAGILRDVDGTILDIQFTDVNPLAGTGTPKPGQKKSDFHTLFAVLSVLVDGAEKPNPQPIFVGSADDFSPTDDGRGIVGDGQLSKSSGWFIFLNSLILAGFDEANFDDSDPTTADYTPLVGARVRFNWQENEKATKKYGVKLGKKVDPKTGKATEYKREDLIVTNYYGQAAAEPVAGTKPAAGAKSAKPAKASKAAAFDVAAAAHEQVVTALAAAKDGTINKSKLSVKILTQMKDAPADQKAAVREWTFVDANLTGLEGVVYDAGTQTLSLEA